MIRETLNNEEGLGVWEFPMANFMERAIILMFRQSIYDYHTLALSHAAALNAWDRVKEVKMRGHLHSCRRGFLALHNPLTRFALLSEGSFDLQESFPYAEDNLSDQ